MSITSDGFEFLDCCPHTGRAPYSHITYSAFGPSVEQLIEEAVKAERERCLSIIASHRGNDTKKSLVDKILRK